MKISDSRPNSRVLKYAPAAARASAVVARDEPLQITDSASVMGISENEQTPKVRGTIMQLMEEVQALRGELEQSRARI